VRRKLCEVIREMSQHWGIATLFGLRNRVDIWRTEARGVYICWFIEKSNAVNRHGPWILLEVCGWWGDEIDLELQSYV
jgi:hypothetical protein